MAPVDNGLTSTIDEMEVRTGYRMTKAQKVIPDEMTFRQWCEKLGAEGMKVDGRRFTLSNRPAMAWIYDQIPTTQEEAFRRTLVLMKCSQVGFTVMEMLATIYLGIKFGPCTVGMFLPDQGLAQIKSTERFMPILRTVPAAHALMTQDATDGTGRKQGEGNVRTRRIGESLYAFAWTSGRATTESIPMDVLSFDEVQEMTLEDMEKTNERLSASEIRYTLMGSTANWPDLDIHHHFKRGTQHRFHTECQTCGARRPLDDYFPACVEFDATERDPQSGLPGVYHYICEAGHRIDDPQVGEWIADRPEAWITSIHFPQFLSPTITANDLMSKYVESTNKKNFYNRVLGKPYLDPSQIPVTLEHMANCVAAGKALGLQWRTRARGTFMGIDQMGQFNVVIIKERLPDGRQAVVHLEEIYSDDPFARCSALMDDYGVAVCVVEVNPNYNDAQRFANRHDGKVFLCNGFGSLPDDMVKWGDAPVQDTSERRTDDEYKTRYTVKADQFRCMQASLARFTAKVPMCLFPDPQQLVQDVIDKGVKRREAIAPRAFLHFTKTALVNEKVVEAGESEATTNRYKRVVRKVGIDPHHSYANQLCDVAWARAHGTATFMLPDVTSTAEEKRALAIEMNMPGLPAHVVAMLPTFSLSDGVCGRCSSYPIGDGETAPVEGLCSARSMIVQARDPGCPFFSGAS
jgi:hypothetical protein